MGVKIIDTLSSMFNQFKGLRKKENRFCGLKKGHLISIGRACAPNAPPQLHFWLATY